MKKVALILLICIYSLSTLGIGVRQFYCCGKLESTDITIVQTKAECGKSESEGTGCCNSKFKSLKVKDYHITSDANKGLVKFFSYLDLQSLEFQDRKPSHALSCQANTGHAPPLSRNVPIYVFQCIYRI